MRIPKQIKIAGHTIKIRTDHESCLSENMNGMAEPDKNLITLCNFEKKEIPDDKAHQILIHEILHMCNAAIGVTEKACDGEEYVEQLSNLLNQVFPQIEG